MAFDVPNQVDQDLDRAPISFGRAIDELCADHFALGDFATRAIIGDDHQLVQRPDQQCPQVLRAGCSAARIASSVDTETATYSVASAGGN